MNCLTVWHTESVIVVRRLLITQPEIKMGNLLNCFSPLFHFLFLLTLCSKVESQLFHKVYTQFSYSNRFSWILYMYSRALIKRSYAHAKYFLTLSKKKQWIFSLQRFFFSFCIHSLWCHCIALYFVRVYWFAFKKHSEID